MSEKISIFRTLRFAGENIFVNKKHLDDVPINANGICEDSKQKFDSLHPEKPKALDSNILFKTLEFKPSKEFSYEKRRDIEKSEEDLIISACKRKNISESELENIKYSLGYKTKDAIYKKPCVAVVGQTKAGKSSLLNCILQDKVVPQKMMRQTARVTYVTHCKFKFVAYMENSMLTKIDLDEDVKEEDVDLKFKDRNKKGKISIEVRAGTPNPIVQNGFDIVDSPGLNENPALNELCERMEKSLLPLLIYVVDGRNGLMQTDIDDIKQIKIRTPQLKIIFFTTKLARSKYDRLMYEEKKSKKRARKELKDNEEMPGESDIEVANRRLDKVLRKMKLHVFVPLSTEILDSRDFHGADIWAINNMRIHKPDDTRSNCDEYNNQLMQWFEESLMLYLKDMLEGPLKQDIQNIQSPLEEALEKATSAASEIATEKHEKKESLKIFRCKEEELFKAEDGYMKTSLRSEINGMIDNCKPGLIKIIEDMESEGKSRRNDPSSQFKEDVKLKFQQLLKLEVEEFIKKFMVEEKKRLKENLNRIVKILKKGKFGLSSFETMLQNRLLLDYEFYDCYQNSRSNSDINRCSDSDISFNSPSFKLIEEKLKSWDSLTEGLFKPPNSSRGVGRDGPISFSQNSRDLADAIIQELDREKFFFTTHDLLTKDFKERHDNFVKLLNEQETFLEENLVRGQDEKKCIREFAESMGVQFALTLHVKTSLCIMIDPMKPKVLIGQGGEADIDKVQLIGGNNKSIVMKSYKRTFKDFKSSDRLFKIAMEIYYSSRLKSKHCLKLLGIHFEDTGDGKKFLAFYPYLEEGTLKKYISGGDIDLKTRMELCIEVAKGIQFLHKHSIIHRDIKLSNVLVKKVNKKKEEYQNKVCDVKAVIADYGLSKSFGFIEHTARVGTLHYVAPELFNEISLVQGSYTSAVDIFSFSIAAWQLLSYKLTTNCDNYYPRFAIECEHDKETIEKLVIDGERPEQRPVIPENVNKLLKCCWHPNPNKRPSFVQTLSELPQGPEDDDFMANETILNVLERNFLQLCK